MMSKNVIIFSDGTGQAGGLRFDENRTNIYKLYRTNGAARIRPSTRMTRSPSTIRAPDDQEFLARCAVVPSRIIAESMVLNVQPTNDRQFKGRGEMVIVGRHAESLTRSSEEGSFGHAGLPEAWVR